MSNADDICGKCGKTRYDTAHPDGSWVGTCIFVEPAPQPAPSGAVSFCPHGTPVCAGCLGNVNEDDGPAPSAPRTDEEFHAHCLNLTVDEARLICECGSGMKTHVFGGHRSCEYFEHHCDSCHERGVCTAHVPVLSKLLALVPVPGAPSGDEAKVRELIEEMSNYWQCNPKALLEAYSVGQSHGVERCKKALGNIIADAIARRGSEGT